MLSEIGVSMIEEVQFISVDVGFKGSGDLCVDTGVNVGCFVSTRYHGNLLIGLVEIGDGITRISVFIGVGVGPRCMRLLSPQKK